MDAMHPRLLVTRFGDCFRFYAAVLPELAGAHLTVGNEQGPYASWDVAGPTPRPAWGPTCRTAHVRDPEGNLLELQSY